MDSRTYKRGSVASCVGVSVVVTASLLLTLYLLDRHLYDLIDVDDAHARYLLHKELNVSRWLFLDGQSSQGFLEDDVVAEKPNQLEVDEPEWERPPFDRVPAAYYIATNNHGFRADPIRPKKGDALRVFFLGDSVTFGKGVSTVERFSDLLARDLGGGVEVFNLGLRGVTSRSEVLILARMLAESPDLVVIEIPCNDLDLALWRARTGSVIDGLRRLAYRQMEGSPLLLSLGYLLGLDTFEEELAAGLDLAERTHASDWEELMDLAAEHGVPVAVLSIPTALGPQDATYPARACASRPGTCLGVIEVDLPRPSSTTLNPPMLATAIGPSDWLRETAMRLRLPVHVLEQVVPSSRSFLDIVHLSPIGHQVVAAQVKAFLEARWPALLARRNLKAQRQAEL